MQSRTDSQQNSNAIELPAPSPMPATDKPQAAHLSKNSSPIDGWVQGMTRTQSELSKDPIRRYHASKRGF